MVKKMGNDSKIDSIIEGLTVKLGGKTFSQSTEVATLSDEQLEIKNFLDERRIKYLIHFTDSSNIPSIKKFGILSVDEMKMRNLTFNANDKCRQDRQTDYISLSVSRMNDYVYSDFRHGTESIKHGIAVVIDASILYEEISTERYYCNTNAANAEVIKGNDYNALADMFKETVDIKSKERSFNRVINRRNSYETTDLQAEILWNKCVPTKYIMFYWDLEGDFFYGE